MQTTKQFRKNLDSAFDQFIKEGDTGPGNRFDRVSEALVFATELANRLAHQRDEAMAELYAYVGTYQAVADHTGLSRARVQQLVERGRG